MTKLDTAEEYARVSSYELNTPATASTAVLPAGERSDSPPLSSSDLPIESSGLATGGARVAARSDGLSGYVTKMADDMGKLMRSSESVGYERGYLDCLKEIIEHVTAGLHVDGDFLSGMLYRPILCKFCKNPLNQSERVMDDACADCAKRFGEDAR